MTNPILLDRAALRLRGIKLHNSTLLRLEAKGLFPKRVKVGSTTYWKSDELETFLASLTRAT